MQRASIVSLAGTFLVLISTSFTIAADATDLPLRKAGRWELKTVMDEGNGPREQTMTMCVDADMERNTAAASAVEHKQSCGKYEVKRTGETVVVESTCTMNGRDVDSRTQMSGDFSKSFLVKIDSTTSGIEGAQSISVKRTITQDGKFLGDSCGDLKGGEAMSADGVKLMVQ